MSSWTSEDELEIKNDDAFNDGKVYLWKQNHTEEYEIGFSDMDCGDASIRTKEECDQLIEFLKRNRDFLK